MTKQELLALVSDNTEAKALIESTFEKATNSEELVTKINDLENKNREIIDSRKSRDTKYKEMLKLLGVEELTPEAVETFKKGNKGGDEALTAEIKNLKGLLENATNDKNTTVSTYEEKLQAMALDNALANAGLGANVANEAMYGIVSNLVREGAVFEDGNIVYKKPGGETLYGSDNKPLTIDNRIADLKSDANYSGLFKVDVSAGTGTPPNTTVGGGSNDIIGMKPIEMMKQGRK